MTKRFLHLAKYLLSFLAIFSFLISLIALPSFRPSHVAMASDRSFIVALIGYKPIIVRLENNTAHAHFDGLDFQGGFVSSGDNFIFDLYAYTDNTTANLEFLYNSFQVMAPYRYALYKLENGIYKPVKSSQWHYAEIINIKRKMSESKKFSSNSLQTIDWKNTFPRLYFLWNKAPYQFSKYPASSEDSNGPIKQYSLITSLAFPEYLYETRFCSPNQNMIENYRMKFDKFVDISRFYPMATPYNGGTTAGFAMYTRKDDIRNKVIPFLSKSCREIFAAKQPTIDMNITQIDLSFWISRFADNHEVEKEHTFWYTNTSSFKFFNPSKDNKGSLISPALGIIASFLSPIDTPVAEGIGIVASILGEVESYTANGAVKIYEDNKENILHIEAGKGFFSHFYAQIPLIEPDKETKDRWHDVSFPLPQRHPEYPFTPFYISFNTSPPQTNTIFNSVLNIHGTIWIETFVRYETWNNYGVRLYDIFRLKYPIYIQLRYRLVK